MLETPNRFIKSVGLRNSDRYYLPATMDSEKELIQKKREQAQRQEQMALVAVQGDPTTSVYGN